METHHKKAEQIFNTWTGFFEVFEYYMQRRISREKLDNTLNVHTDKTFNSLEMYAERIPVETRFDDTLVIGGICAVSIVRRIAPMTRTQCMLDASEMLNALYDRASLIIATDFEGETTSSEACSAAAATGIYGAVSDIIPAAETILTSGMTITLPAQTERFIPMLYGDIYK